MLKYKRVKQSNIIVFKYTEIASFRPVWKSETESVMTDHPVIANEPGVKVQASEAIPVKTEKGSQSLTEYTQSYAEINFTLCDIVFPLCYLWNKKITELHSVPIIRRLLRPTCI